MLVVPVFVVLKFQSKPSYEKGINFRIKVYGHTYYSPLLY